MNSQQFLDEMIKIQSELLEFLDNESDTEENFQNLNNILKDQNLFEDKHKLKLFLRLLCEISKYHQRGQNFFEKIEQILKLFKEEIKRDFTNQEIFDFFKGNKRILLFLFEEKLLTMDSNIRNTMMQEKYKQAKYPQYFAPELRTSVFFKPIQNELPENFNENRKIGENESKICQLIRKDMLKEFIVYINQNNISINNKIEESIFETNSLFVKKTIRVQNKSIFQFRSFNFHMNNSVNFIEYAAFYGSLEIFNYLYLNKCELRPFLWVCAIHGQNPEIIHLLEENNINPNDGYINLFNESIKLHHIDITNYIINNHLKNNDEKSTKTINLCIKYCNFTFMNNELFVQSSFVDLCKYDYYSLVKILITEKNIKINEMKISFNFFNDI